MAFLDNIISQTPIKLPTSNMYANGRQIIFADGTGKLRRYIVVYDPTEPDSYYPVKHGDIITQIAYQKYKSFFPKASHYWWMIADANKMINPLDLTRYLGVEIIIPNIANFKLINNA